MEWNAGERHKKVQGKGESMKHSLLCIYNPLSHAATFMQLFQLCVAIYKKRKNEAANTLFALSGHILSYIMQTPNRPVIIYVFTILALLLFSIDKFFQWRTVQERSRRYFILQSTFLGVILLSGAGLISFIEFEISRQRIAWLPAVWALLSLSILLSLAIEVRTLHLARYGDR
jgi:uncharacterized membrane protein SirB2